MKPAEEVSSQHQSQFLQEQSKKTAGNDAITGTAPIVQVSSTSGVLPDTSIEELSIRRVHADIYTNSAAALEKVSPDIVTSLQRLSLLPSNPTPIISTSTMSIKNLSTEEITARLVIDENRGEQQSANSKNNTSSTIINQYSAGLMVLVPELSLLDMKVLKNKLWNLPLRNSNFIGREKLLQELTVRFQQSVRAKEALENKSKSMVAVVCHGIGGVGKTQVAIELAYQQNNPIMHWIPAETPAQIDASYIAIAKTLGIFDENQLIEEIIKNVKAWIMNHPCWLLIFDNAQNYSEIEKYIPEFGCDVLVTSRCTDWPAEMDVKVDIFNEEESRRYIKRLLGDRPIDTEELINSLAFTMGYLPLALAQACGYIRQNKININSYITKYEQRKYTFLVSATLPPGDKHVPVYITWDVSLDEINKGSKFAAKLLYLCAYLSSEDIPFFLLNELAKDKELNCDDEDFEEVLGLLQRYSLITLNPERKVVTIHRVIQEVMRIKLQQAKQEELFVRKIITYLNQLFTYKKYVTTVDEWDNTKRVSVTCEQLLNHVFTISNIVCILTLMPEDPHSLLLKLAQYLIDVKSDFTLAQVIIEKLMQLHNRSNLKENLLAHADLSREKSSLFMALGNYEQAIKELEEVLKLYEINSNLENKTVLLSIVHCQLGNAYYYINQREKAEIHFRKVFLLEANNTGVQTSVNIAVAWCGLGNIKLERQERETEALPYINALEIYMELSVSKVHRSIALVNLLLANIDLKNENFNKALERFNTAKNIYQKIFDTEYHVDVAICVFSMSRVLYRLNKLEESLSCVKHALQIYIRIYTLHGNIDIIPITFHLGYLLCRMNNYAEGLAEYEKSVKIYFDIFKDKNNDSSIINLYEYAKRYYQLGDITKAEQCYILILVKFYYAIAKRGTILSFIDNIGISDNAVFNVLIPKKYDYSTQANVHKQSLLIRACYEGDISRVRDLSQSIKRIDDCDDNGVNPLYAATKNGHLDVIKFLIEVCGAKISLYNKSTGPIETPIFIASQNNHFDVVEYFMLYINNKKNKDSEVWDFPVRLGAVLCSGPRYTDRNARIANLVENYFAYQQGHLLHEQATELLLQCDEDLLPGLRLLQDHSRKCTLREDALQDLIFGLCALDSSILYSLLKNFHANKDDEQQSASPRIFQQSSTSQRTVRNISDRIAKSAFELLVAIGVKAEIIQKIKKFDYIKNKVVDLAEYLNVILHDEFIFDSKYIYDNGLLRELKVTIESIEKIMCSELILIQEMDFILEQLNSGHALIRFAARNAVLKLKLLNHTYIQTNIIKMFTSENWKIRQEGIELVSEMDGLTPTSEIVSAILQDRVFAVKQTAAIALIKKNYINPLIIRILKEGLINPYWKIRYRSIYSLKYFSDFTLISIELLVPCIRDKDNEVCEITKTTLIENIGKHRTCIINALIEHLLKVNPHDITVQTISLLRELTTSADSMIGMFLLTIAKEKSDHYFENEICGGASQLLKAFFVNDQRLFEILIARTMWYSLKALINAVLILPKFKEILFQETIVKSDKFTKFVKSIKDLKAIIKIYPEHKEELILLFKRLVVHVTIFSDFVKHMDFIEMSFLMRKFPEYHPSLLKLLTENPLTFTQNLTSEHMLLDFAELYPDKKNLLFSTVVEDPLWFIQNVNSCGLNLRPLVRLFKNHKNRLFVKTVGNNVWFKKNVKDCDNLKEIVNLFEEQTSVIFELTINNHSWFSTVVSNIYSLEVLKTIVPTHMQRIFEKSAGNIIWNCEHTTSAYDIERLIKVFPDKVRLIYMHTVADTDWLLQYRRRGGNLQELAKIFPEMKRDIELLDENQTNMSNTNQFLM